MASSIRRCAQECIKPHRVVPFHDAQSKASKADALINYIDYGRRLERVIAEVTTELVSTR